MKALRQPCRNEDGWLTAYRISVENGTTELLLGGSAVRPEGYRFHSACRTFTMSLKIVSSTLPASEVSSAAEPRLLHDAREMLQQQAEAVLRVGERLDQRFLEAVQTILSCQGRLVVCGMGKSGLIGRKMSATFASTGTPSFFLHPGEASHGDLGMVTPNDVVLLISNSGETEEVLRLVPYFRDVGIPMIAMVGRETASLTELVDVVLDIAVEREACPLNLAPTTSTLVTLALGDALAASLIRARGFRALDFARLHPGGALGRRLTSRVQDVMQKNRLPFVRPDQSVSECLIQMTQGRCGLAIIVGDEQQLLGVVTDGDLRRALQRDSGLLGRATEEIMTRQPVTISEDATLAEAEELMQRLRIKALLAQGIDGRVTGVVEIFSKNS